MKVCVFGSSSSTLDEQYINRTEDLGFRLAKNGHTLVFGAGKNGLMGAAARGFTKGNGKIIGVVPRFFEPAGVIYEHCDELVFTDTMRDRKKYMEDISDAFIITPGGIGTYEEFFEVLTLKQLARHAKPIVIFNINSFFDPLISMMKASEEQRFIRAQTARLFHVTDDTDTVISLVENDSFDINAIQFYD